METAYILIMLLAVALTATVTALAVLMVSRRQSQANADSLRQENARSIAGIIDPLQRDISDFKKTVGDYYLNESNQRHVVAKQVENLILANHKVSEETRRLADALHGNNSVQGDWGETMLETLLTRVGMIKDVNYIPQATHDDKGNVIRDENGTLQRPDMLLLLPDDHKIVIDSKVSLRSYLDYFNAYDAIEQQAAIKKHTESVRRHIDELARKQYHKNIKGAMEHTLMFIPNDAAYIAAVTHDPNLTDYAWQRKVVIVSATHLMSVLQMISQLWRVEKQNRNAEEIAKTGGLIFDKIANFLADFKAVATNIDNARTAYEKCVAHIDHPSVGIKARAQRLQQLGSKTTKSIPH